MALWQWTFCTLLEHTSDKFLQLESRPQGVSNRCTYTTLSTVHVPSLCLNRSLLAEDPQRGGSLCPPGSTNMAVADMVPTGTGDVGGSTSNPSGFRQPSPELTKQTTSPSHSGSFDTRRMAYIRGSLSDQGFSERIADIICASWRNHTIQLGGDGFAGVVEGKSIQFLPHWWASLTFYWIFLEKRRNTVRLICTNLPSQCFIQV